LKLVAACAFGLEAIVKRELISLGYEPKVSQPGRIEFEGDWLAVCRTNLWLRVADRILIVVQKFDAPDFDALFDTVKAFDWSQFIPGNAAFPVTGRSRLSKLTSVPAVQRTVKKALVESLQKFHGRTELPETGPSYKVDVAILNDVATLTLDTTGSSLHKRGYRKLVAEAPIKETLAAAMVNLSVWKDDRPLVDPFCGSGTIPIEAALAGLNIAPGLQRTFSCSQWDLIEAKHWNDAMSEALDLRVRDRTLQIIGTDRDKEVLSLARYHAEQAGVADQIHFQQKSFDQLRSKREYGCVISNPPYGERLEEQKRLLGLYQSIPAVMQRLPTWSLFLITNISRFEYLVQRQATRRRKLFNGRLECTYYQFLGPKPPADFKPSTGPVIDSADSDSINSIKDSGISDTEGTITQEHTVSVNSEESTSSQPKPTASVAPIFGELTSKDKEQADLFKSRLVKRARHLRRWPTRRGITCFRLYEKDIPEIPLVVDRYEDFVHISEYDRPHDRNIARHAAWLELMARTAASALDVPISHVYLKPKKKSSSTRQYERVDAQRKLIPVKEGDLTFLVNLSDYVDTGLFLDHRITRKMVRDEAKGKHVLNLFAYTGSFSVYAAAGEAESTMTVDLSKNYLDWAKRNFESNKLFGPQHQFVVSDTIDFLRSIADEPELRFDLAVVDPPTYSNSKQTEEDWDVQARHVELLKLVHQAMSPKGIVYFSTNFRRFKFAEDQLPEFEVREISKQTVPEDFRNKRIHRCWRLVCKSE
jgi:23S rRNA (guanine2445-N2)-methyltransferase / 23S rRNA (guanine2069-N7)-methyltransferase